MTTDHAPESIGKRQWELNQMKHTMSALDDAIMTNDKNPQTNAAYLPDSSTGTSVNNEDAVAYSNSMSSPDRKGRGISVITSRRAFATIGILFFINLINYMDRFTIAGVLKKIKTYYSISDSDAGLLQTSFICSYMIFSPIFGYLGDRYTRRYIMAFGICMWAIVTFIGSFMPADYYWAFVLFRALVGIGEASYSTIAPTIIADLYAKEQRSKMLMIFYFAIPVGSGLGYIVGSEVADLIGEWQYALRITPALGIASVVLVLLFVPEPIRGMSDGGVSSVRTSYFTDLKEIVKVKSFMASSGGFTCVAFSTGALAFFAPLYMLDAINSRGIIAAENTVSLTFGVITCVAGFAGVALGIEVARRYKKINPRADPLICAIGMLSCAPFLYLALVLSRIETYSTWVLILIGETFLCLNWAVTADIVLYTIVPSRRSSAQSVQILMSHMFGDAISPYLLGVVSDNLQEQFADGGQVTLGMKTQALQYALFGTAFVCVIGGGFYLVCALFIERDKATTDKFIKELEKAALLGTSINSERTDIASAERDIQSATVSSNGPT